MPEISQVGMGNPVGAGSGIYTMDSRPDFEKLVRIKSMDELPKEDWANIFFSIFQASKAGGK
jgi:hypothetical protein